MSYCSTCGGNGRMWDSTDHEPWAAHLVSDADIESYWEAWMRKGRGQELGTLLDPLDYERELYQCPECGRLLVESDTEPGVYYLFVPENEGGPVITGPAEGSRWRHFLSGGFNPSDPGCTRTGPGCVWEHTGKNQEYRYFETLQETKDYFFQRRDELLKDNLLGSAFFTEFGKVTYRWEYNDAEPAQEKWELFLAKDEQREIARFKEKHKLCNWYYPHPDMCGPFAYEVIPSSVGPEFRIVRVTCRFCGAYVESSEGAISHGKPYKEMLSESECRYGIPIDDYGGGEDG